MDLSSIPRVKALLGIDKPDWDDLLLSQIGAVSAEVERYLDRVTKTGTYTERFDVPLNGPDQIFSLEAYPVTAVVTVHYDPDREFAAADLLDADDYALQANGKLGRLLIFAELSAWPDSIKVSYTGGMAADPTTFIAAFPDIAYAVDLQVAFLYQRRRDLGVTSISGDAGTVTHSGIRQFKREVHDILAPHRRMAYR